MEIYSDVRLRDKIAIFLLFLFIYLLTMGGHLYSPDEELMFRTTQSLVSKGSLAIEPLFGFGTKTGKDGREYAQYGVGQSIAAIPLYFLGKGIHSFSSGAFFQILFYDTVQYHNRNRTDYTLRFFVSLFNQIITALTVVLLAVFGWWLSGEKRAAIMLAMLYGLGTLALPHSRTFFSEPLAGLLVLASLFFLFKGTLRLAAANFAVAGLTYGYAILTRMDSIFFFPGLALFLFLENTRYYPEVKGRCAFLWVQFRRSALRSWLLFLLPILFFLGVVLFLNYLRYEDFFATGYEDQPERLKFTTPLLVGLYGFLFSVGKGLFFFSPPLILFLFALRGFWAEWRNLTLAIFVMLGIFLLVQSCWQNWAGGWCWGPRHIFQLHALFSLPIVMLFKPPRLATIRIAYPTLLIIGLAVQLYGASQSFIDFYWDFYRTPAQPPNAYALYSAEELDLLNQYYHLSGRPETRNQKPETIDLSSLIAPINDSIYVVQNSQWYGYKVMWKSGRSDFFWLRLIRATLRTTNKEG